MTTGSIRGLLGRALVDLAGDAYVLGRGKPPQTLKRAEAERLSAVLITADRRVGPLVGGAVSTCVIVVLDELVARGHLSRDVLKGGLSDDLVRTVPRHVLEHVWVEERWCSPGPETRQ